MKSSLDICVAMENRIIEEILIQFKTELGKDYHTYRNHVYRIFSICTTLDDQKENRKKYAIASVFHDLGIWVKKTFDYLEPSILLANQHLESINKTEWIEEISLMIDMHHKRSKYRGAHQETVEFFRRADWMDVTKGRKLFGFEKSDYIGLTKRHPFLGFHKFLFIQTLKNFLKSPMNPLPMFKK